MHHENTNAEQAACSLNLDTNPQFIELLESEDKEVVDLVTSLTFPELEIYFWNYKHIPDLEAGNTSRQLGVLNLLDLVRATSSKVVSIDH